MLNCSSRVSGHAHSDQDGLVSLSGEGLVMCTLSRVAEVHIMLVAAGIWLKEVAGPIGCDPHFVA